MLGTKTRFQIVAEAIRAGERITRRYCTVCCEPILYVAHGGGPALYSCPCRELGLNRLVLLTWEQFGDLLSTPA